MDEKTVYWASIGLGAAALVLLVVNMSTISNNRLLQEEITQRKATIDNTATLDQINRGIVQALADTAIKDSDSDARNLLAAQGITITPPAPAAKSEEPKEIKKKSEKKED